MPIAPHNNIAHICVKVPGPTCSCCVLAARLDDDNDPVTMNPAPPKVVTDDKPSVGTDADHPDKEDWHEDWTISDAEGAETPKRADGFNFAKDNPQSETVVNIDEEEKLSSLSANCIINSITFLLERSEP
jgi:hypothetical protein